MPRLFLTLFLFAAASFVAANNPYFVHCEKGGCDSCTTSSCEPGDSTYVTSATFKTEKEASSYLAEMEQRGYVCSVKEILPNSGDGTNPDGDDDGSDGSGGGGGGGGGSPGVTAASYSRASILFSGVTPDYVRSETIGGKRLPKQLPIKNATRIYSDLPDGFQVAQYTNSSLSDRAADGLRTVPAGAQPSAITMYKNPDGGTTTSTGRLDIVHKQRHPQSGAWITRTIRKTAPQGENNWKTEFFLGDPTEPDAIPIQSYREITITRTPNANGTESTREITRDRATDGSLVITSDISATYAFYKFGEPVKISETRHTGTASELTVTTTYHTDSHKPVSYNKPATIRRSDGSWENISYQGSLITGTIVTKTVSGWLDNPAPAAGDAPDEATNRVVTEIEAFNETGTFSRVEKIQGVTVSNTWGERFKDKSGMVVEKSHVETGAARLTTLSHRFSNDRQFSVAERGKLKSVQYPDGTVEIHSYTAQGDNIATTTDRGVGTISAVTDGTRTLSVHTKQDILIKETVMDISSGITLSTREAIAFDSNNQPTRWVHDNNFDDFSETINGCCGVDSTRSRDGITTSYTRDGLKRPKTETSRGITLTYTYGSHDIGGTAFPSVKVTATAGSLTLNRGTTVYDLSGNVILQISPDLDGDCNEEQTTTSRDYASHTTTTTQPDGGTIVQTDFIDGQSKSTTGTATSPQFYSHSTHNEQGGGRLSASAPTAAGPWSKSYSNLAGSTFKNTFDDGSTETVLQSTEFDNLGRAIKTTDADGVTQLTAYNAKGEAYRSAIDLNQNGQIDAADRVSDTVQDILEIPDFGPAIRSRSLIYDENNAAITVSTSLRSPNGQKSRQESLGVAAPAIAQGASYEDKSDGTWTETSTAPDGTQQVTQYTNWLATISSSLDSAGATLESQQVSYDAFHRPTVTTHSRTGAVTTTYSPSGQVTSINDHDRITSFSYDNMGRRVSTTLPDGTVSHTSYWITGQVKATWGSQTNPTVKFYDTEGRLTKLRTFRSSNITLAPDESTTDFDETSWIYDARGQLARKQYADGKGTDYTYTAGGRMKTRTWARGVVTTYGYNPAGELVTTDYSDTTPDVTVAFDKLGRQTSISNGIAKSEFAYDPATLRLTQETISYNLDGQAGFEFTRVLDRSHDTLGRPTGWQLKNGTTIENQVGYQYGVTDGRLASITAPSGTFNYSYLANSNLIAQVSGPSHTVTNTYEPHRNVLTSKENKVDTTTISKYAYAVNPLNQRTNVTQTGTAFAAPRDIAWGYDPLGQVTSADSSENTQDRAYQYDAIGNRQRAAAGTLDASDPTATVYASNTLNQYTTIQENSANNPVNPVNTVPTYDQDGNTLTEGTKTHTWDGENRLIKVQIGETEVNYQYDSQSRRITRKQSPLPLGEGQGEGDTQSDLETAFLYDGWNNIAEYSVGTGILPVLSKSYTWGMDLSGSIQGAGGVGGLLSVHQHGTDPSNQSPIANNFFPTFDGNGNISEYLDEEGTTAAHFEYDPFGNTTVNTDTENNFPYRFSTKPLDQTTSYYYYGYRDYEAPTGRWKSRDPIEEQGGMNLYSYVGNDGVSQWDILGLSGWEWFSIVSKSYINGVDGLGELPPNMGHLPLEKLLSLAAGNPLIKALIDAIAGRVFADANTRLQVFASTLGQFPAFDQNPEHDRKDGLYRLYTKVFMKVCCVGGKPKRAEDDWDKDGGKEMPGVYGTIWLRYRFIDNIDNFKVVWTGWGRPNLLAEPAMQWVGFRNDKIRGLAIWHEGTATVTCDSNDKPQYTLDSFMGGKFPSRQVWFNGISKDIVEQGDLADLWNEHPTRKGFVK